MEVTRLNFDNEFQKKIPKMIEAFTMFYGEEERENITDLFSNTVMIGYVNEEVCKRVINDIKKECVKKAVEFFFEKIDLPFNQSNFEKYFGTYIRDFSQSELDFFYNAVDRNNLSNYFLGIVKKFAEDDSLTLEDDKAIKMIDKIKSYRPAYNEAQKYFNDELDKYKNEIEFFDKLTILKHTILEKYRDELIEELHIYFNEQDKKYYEDNKEKGSSHLSIYIDKKNMFFSGYGGLDTETLIDAFTCNSELILEKNENNMLVNRIKRNRIEYFKSEGFDFGDDYDLYITNKECLAVMPSRELADKIVKIKHDKQEAFLKKFTLSLPQLQSGYKRLDSIGINGDKLDDVASCINNEKTLLLTNIILKNGEPKLVPIILINGNYDKKTIDTRIIHELNHLFELYIISVNKEKKEITYSTGWDILTEDVNGLVNGKKEIIGPRKYEMYNEIINEYISQDISRLMHENGIYLFSNEKEYLNTSRSGYEEQLKHFSRDFYDTFKELIIKSRKEKNLDILTDVIGKENFEAYNDLLNTISQRYTGMRIYAPLMDLKQGNTTTPEAKEFLGYIEKYWQLLENMIVLSKSPKK